MKEWFQYEFGFVNIDEQNLYLTNTGNWSETEGLEEKSVSTGGKSKSKSTYAIVFLVLAFGLFAFLIFKNAISGRIGLTLIALTVGGGYKLYEYMRTEIGAAYKIPLGKITEVRTDQKNIEIIFVNGDGNADSHILQGVDEKGMVVMNSLLSRIRK